MAMQPALQKARDDFHLALLTIGFLAKTISNDGAAAWQCVEVALVGRLASVVVCAPAVPSGQDDRRRGGKQWS